MPLLYLFTVDLLFPNRESVIRLMGALLMEVDEKWASGKKYLDMAEYFEWLQAQEQKRYLLKLHELASIIPRTFLHIN